MVYCSQKGGEEVIQIKCGNCKMVCNIDEESFALRKGEKGYIFDSPVCASCGNEIPPAFVNHLFRSIKKENFEGWEVGTHFEE